MFAAVRRQQRSLTRDVATLSRKRGAEVRFASRAALWHIVGMSNRELVMDLLSKLPEDMPLEEVAREIEFLAGIQTARQQARRREGIPAEDARKLVDAWVGQ